MKVSGTEHTPIEKKGAKQEPKKQTAKKASARSPTVPAAAPTTPKPTTYKRKRDETEQSDAAKLGKKA